ncbi:MAG: zinc-ribbon domain-containing protein [Anaerolineae bacterium]|nr:zinc-ribbon domain-containing protein [Anaerolineae bacterium]
MDILTLLITLILVGGMLALVLYPLWSQTRPANIDYSGRTLAEDEARYQAVLAAIRDLMFDYEMGKVSREDYDTLLPQTKLEAARIRQQIDLKRGTAAPEIDPALDAEIEALIATFKGSHLNDNETLQQEVDAEIQTLKNIPLKAQTGQPACPSCGQALVVGDTFCSGCGQALANFSAKIAKNTCPHCHHPLQPGDAYCPKCGMVVNSDLAIRNQEIIQTAGN